MFVNGHAVKYHYTDLSIWQCEDRTTRRLKHASFKQKKTLFGLEYSPLNAKFLFTIMRDELASTGCPAVDVTTLIAHISLMPGPIIKPFDSMQVKTG